MLHWPLGPQFSLFRLWARALSLVDWPVGFEKKPGRRGLHFKFTFRKSRAFHSTVRDDVQSLTPEF